MDSSSHRAFASGQVDTIQWRIDINLVFLQKRLCIDSCLICIADNMMSLRAWWPEQTNLSHVYVKIICISSGITKTQFLDIDLHAFENIPSYFFTNPQSALPKRAQIDSLAKSSAAPA